MSSKIDQLTITNYLKRYGFVFQSSEIYGGLANSWDYGPLGVLLKNNIKNLWWNFFITSQTNMVGIDSSIILNQNVWKASGHLDNFSDPLVDCKNCHQRFRVDKLINNQLPKMNINENTPLNQLSSLLSNNKIVCPNCGKSDWTGIRHFNLMFKTYQSVIENKENEVYLRPETAQGIFINFINIQRSLRLKVPFGVGQIGKAFRNEITPGNFIYRTREFEQMEIEFFSYPNEAEKYFNFFEEKIQTFLFKKLQIKKENICKYDHPKEDLSHYSLKTIDFQYNFPHGWSELWGLANRTDFDLTNHKKCSSNNLSYFDQKSNKYFIPYVVEPSVGVERLFYAIICDKYKVMPVENNETREVLALPYELCPYKIAVLPLSSKLSDKAKEIYTTIIKHNISATYDVSGSIGKRYRRQDAIGTFYCITYDFDSINDNCVTIRNRDTMEQKRIKIDEIIKFLSK